MNKQELIEKIEDLETLGLISERINKNEVLDLVEQLDEPQKPVVLQFVADWIEYFKKCSGTLYGSTAPYSYYGRAITDDFEGDVTEVLGWIRDNSEVYARAWLDGYEAEEEKRYLVKIKGNIKENMLVYGELLERYFFTKSLSLDNAIYSHTRKELEEVGFDWVFDCPGIDIVEVEE